MCLNIRKSVTFLDQITNQHTQLECFVSTKRNLISLKSILKIFLKKMQLPKLQTFILSTSTKTVTLPETYQIDQEFCSQSHLTILYDSTDILEKEVRRLPIKERNKQRSIREVICHVKQWRDARKIKQINQKKTSLLDAAKVVGISKKSLDDYYCQLRLAQQYGFDFEGNWHEKIGILRRFVKQHRDKQKLTDNVNKKLPKSLKILDFIGVSKELVLSKNNQNVDIQMEEKNSSKFLENFQNYKSKKTNPNNIIQTAIESSEKYFDYSNSIEEKVQIQTSSIQIESEQNFQQVQSYQQLLNDIQDPISFCKRKEHPRYKTHALSDLSPEELNCDLRFQDFM